MGFILEDVREDIVAFLNSNVAQPVNRGAVPEPEDIVYTNGLITPYVVVNFGDMAQGGSRSFIGARGDGYYMMVNVFCIAQDAVVAEKIQSKVIDVLLGYKPQYAGQLNKMPGGSSFSMLQDQSRPSAFAALASFRVAFNTIEVP